MVTGADTNFGGNSLGGTATLGAGSIVEGKVKAGVAVTGGTGDTVNGPV
jgi:hypothetical protein